MGLIFCDKHTLLMGQDPGERFRAIWSFCLSSFDFFFSKSSSSKKIFSGIPSEYQTVWIKIRPDFLSDLIWVQTVFKVYQQMKLVYQQTTIVGKKLSSRAAYQT